MFEDNNPLSKGKLDLEESASHYGDKDVSTVYVEGK